MRPMKIADGLRDSPFGDFYVPPPEKLKLCSTALPVPIFGLGQFRDESCEKSRCGQLTRTLQLMWGLKARTKISHSGRFLNSATRFPHISLGFIQITWKHTIPFFQNNSSAISDRVRIVKIYFFPRPGLCSTVDVPRLRHEPKSARSEDNGT
jgi:hypothetical protein